MNIVPIEEVIALDFYKELAAYLKSKSGNVAEREMLR